MAVVGHLRKDSAPRGHGTENRKDGRRVGLRGCGVVTIETVEVTRAEVVPKWGVEIRNPRQRAVVLLRCGVVRAVPIMTATVAVPGRSEGNAVVRNTAATGIPALNVTVTVNPRVSAEAAERPLLFESNGAARRSRAFFVGRAAQAFITGGRQHDGRHT